MTEQDYKKEIFKIVMSCYHNNVPGMVWAQLKKYHNKLNMTYEGMYKTFLYVLEVKGLTFERKYGVGYVKFFYQQGKNYTRKSHNGNPQVKTERREIVIKKQSHKPVVKKINMEDIDK